jgi:hypothetical protein
VAARDALDAFVEELIPTDDLPGAAEAGTAESVRQALAERPAVAALSEAGFRALERASQQMAGLAFAALPSEQRQHLMRLLARGSPPPGWTAADPPPEVFWSTVRGLALALFYGGPVGRQVTGFPGPVVDRGGYRHTIVEPDPLRAGTERHP